jgi:hypothetical protein
LVVSSLLIDIAEHFRALEVLRERNHRPVTNHREFGWTSTPGNLVHCLDQQSACSGIELRTAEIGPTSFDRRPKFGEKSRQSTFAAGKVEYGAWSSTDPARRQPYHYRRFNVGKTRNTIRGEMNRFPPERKLKTVDKMARHFPPQAKYGLSQRTINRLRAPKDTRRRLDTAAQLHRRHQIRRIARVRDEEAIRIPHPFLQAGRGKPRRTRGDQAIGRDMDFEFQEGGTLEFKPLG